MKTSEIRELTNQELVERIDTEEMNYTKMRMNHAVSPLDNPSQLQNARRNVARLKAEHRKRQISENQKSA